MTNALVQSAPSKLERFEIPDLLRDLIAVVAVILDGQGNVRDANRGFKYLLNQEHIDIDHWNVRDCFVQPSFSELRAIYSEDSAPIYRGIINLGDANTYCRSIEGSVYRYKDLFLVVGEYDVAQLEELNSTVIELNEELGQLQRELVKANRDLKRNEKKITAMMLTDPLTGISNRRHFDQRIHKEIDLHLRHAMPLAIAMGDIDLFKSVNDNYGHDVGDEVIMRFAHTLRDSKRSSDFVARIGGEEFIIILPQTTMAQAHLVIDRLRESFSAESYNNIERKITASFGITELKAGDDQARVIKRVDQALYEAKNAGRNTVISSP